MPAVSDAVLAWRYSVLLAHDERSDFNGADRLLAAGALSKAQRQRLEGHY